MILKHDYVNIDDSKKYKMSMIKKGDPRDVNSIQTVQIELVQHKAYWSVKAYKKGYEDIYLNDDYFSYLMDCGKIKIVKDGEKNG